MLDLIEEWWEKKFFRVAVFLIFGLVCFQVFLIATFPEHRLAQIVENQIEASVDHEYTVSIGELGLWRLTGVRADQVQLRERSSAEDEGIPRTVRVERMAARFSLLRTILNRGPTVRYQVDVGGGTIDGSLSPGEDGTQRVRADFNGLDLRDSTLLASLVGWPIFGVIDGDIDLLVDLNTGMVQGGTIELDGEQLTLGSTVVSVDEFPVDLELPTTSFGTIRASISAEGEGSQTVFRVDEWQTRGRDIQTEMWGDLRMSQQGVQPDLKFRFQVNQEYVTEHDLGAVFNWTEFREGEYQDWYGFAITTRRGSTEVEGSRSAAEGPGAGEEGAEGDDD